MYSPRVSDASPVTRRTACQARSWGSHTTTTITPPPAPVDTSFKILKVQPQRPRRRKEAGVVRLRLISFRERGTSPVSDSATLCSQELPTATPQPPTLLHTDSLGDTDRERRKGGCYSVAPSLCYLSGPFYDRCTTEGTAEYM